MVSTIELAREAQDVGGGWDLAGRPYAMRQHRGRRNGHPPVEAKAALARLRESLRTMAIDGAALEPRVYAGQAITLDLAARMALWEAILPGDPPWGRLAPGRGVDGAGEPPPPAP